MDDRNNQNNSQISRQLSSLAAYAACLVVIWFWNYACEIENDRRTITHDLRIEGERVRSELMSYLFSTELCRNILRMTPPTFIGLCEILVREGGLRPTLRTTVEEQVAKALYLLAHNVTNRELAFFFRRSGESVSRHFHTVLRAILGLYEKFIKQPDGFQILSEIASSQRFYRYFKDCIGAIDGTHIRVKVSQSEAPKYRGRKDYPTQNVLAACTFDLKFTYVLAGREGTTSDSRIMKEALNKQDPLRIPEGKYYLVDAGFMLRSGLITPYRGERYHLKEGVDPDDWLLAEVDAELINDINVLEEPSNSKEIANMPKRSKPSSSDINVLDNNSVCVWSNAMDDALIDAFHHQHILGNRAKPEAAEFRNKPIRNYDKLIVLYGKDRATGKHAETGSDMLKRSAHNNSRRSSTASLTIDEVDELISMNDAPLENTEKDGQDEQEQTTPKTPTLNAY
uniref:Uncharacterized protein LOC104240661 n=1 Tax=Nicotiana sylvestris TaxID=4096 RepID=A0A1U7XW48_NICSY|nr:PREDICTED: uncharacterized protein LOC104240661 [Nicotiana sylvestris]